ncbi:adenylate kinase [Enteropsectra breve]|nr:adenylate kinase [Enteropsectra breve]
MKILITGTPGVGKTTFSERCSNELSIEHIDVTKFIKENKLYENYNQEFDSYEFDSEKVAKKLYEAASLQERTIIDTHSPSVAYLIDFDFIFHIKCCTKVLYKRLSDRNYSKLKIEENILCENMDIVGEELEECFDQDAYIIDEDRLNDGGDAISFEDALLKIRNAILSSNKKQK